MGRCFALVSTILIASIAAASLSAATTLPIPKVGVSLTVTGATPDLTVGDDVMLTAKAKLPRGTRLLIERLSRNGRSWKRIQECAASPCTTEWSEPNPDVATFRARVVHRKRGAAGTIDSVAGTSGSVAVTWHEPPPPPPPPPAPPAALAGHYCGFNDQGKSVCFDVLAGNPGTVANFVTESIVTCTDGSRRQEHTTFDDERPITDLAFSYSYDGPLFFSDPSYVNATSSYVITGTFDTSGNATGTLAMKKISWDRNGVHYDCSSAPYGWHAKLNA